LARIASTEVRVQIKQRGGHFDRESVEGGPGSGPHAKLEHQAHNLQKSMELTKDPAARKVLRKRIDALRSQMIDQLGKDMGESSEGGPGSGPRAASGLGRPFDKKMSRHDSLVRRLDKATTVKAIRKIRQAIRENLRSHQKGEESRGREAEANTQQMVAPRYDKSHPEGFESPEYAGIKKEESREGGPGSGPHSDSGEEHPAVTRARAELNQAKEKARLHPDQFRDRQRNEVDRRVTRARADLNQALAKYGGAQDSNRESRVTKPASWTARQTKMHKKLAKQTARQAVESRRGNDLPEDDGEYKPIHLSNYSQPPSRVAGWSNNGSSYSPPVSNKQPERQIEIREF
jgi:hypothetical protein